MSEASIMSAAAADANARLPASSDSLAAQGQNNSCSIAVTICTRGRPQRLKMCLESILAMSVPVGVHPLLIVVENDESPDCQGVVLNLRMKAPSNWQIIYSHEPRLGIPIARNRGLEVALNLEVDWVAFIDDDEVATPDWLRAMLVASRTYQADVLQGPVEYVYPDTTPAWIERKKSRRRASGSQLATAYTNNVMMRSSVAAREGMNLSFDESMRFTGGSDTEYYYRASDNGAVICWVDEALIKEPVTPERLTIGWQVKRAMRVAANSTTLHRRRFGLARSLARYAPKCVSRIIGGASMAIVSLPASALRMPAGQRLLFKGLKNLYSGLGGIGAFINFTPQPYLQIDGDLPAAVRTGAQVEVPHARLRPRPAAVEGDSAAVAAAPRKRVAGG